MKASELKDIILNELFKNESFKKLFVKMRMEKRGSDFIINIQFTDEMVDDYFDEDDEYDWNESEEEYADICKYTVDVVKNIITKKFKNLKYNDWETDGPDIYVYFEDITISNDDSY